MTLPELKSVRIGLEQQISQLFPGVAKITKNQAKQLISVLGERTELNESLFSELELIQEEQVDMQKMLSALVTSYVATIENDPKKYAEIIRYLEITALHQKFALSKIAIGADLRQEIALKEPVWEAISLDDSSIAPLLKRTNKNEVKGGLLGAQKDALIKSIDPIKKKMQKDISDAEDYTTRRQVFQSTLGNKVSATDSDALIIPQTNVAQALVKPYGPYYYIENGVLRASTLREGNLDDLTTFLRNKNNFGLTPEIIDTVIHTVLVAAYEKLVTDSTGVYTESYEHKLRDMFIAINRFGDTAIAQEHNQYFGKMMCYLNTLHVQEFYYFKSATEVAREDHRSSSNDPVWKQVERIAKKSLPSQGCNTLLQENYLRHISYEAGQFVREQVITINEQIKNVRFLQEKREQVRGLETCVNKVTELENMLLYLGKYASIAGLEEVVGEFKTQIIAQKQELIVLLNRYDQGQVWYEDMGHTPPRLTFQRKENYYGEVEDLGKKYGGSKDKGVRTQQLYGKLMEQTGKKVSQEVLQKTDTLVSLIEEYEQLVVTNPIVVEKVKQQFTRIDRLFVEIYKSIHDILKNINKDDVVKAEGVYNIAELIKNRLILQQQALVEIQNTVVSGDVSYMDGGSLRTVTWEHYNRTWEDRMKQFSRATEKVAPAPQYPLHVRLTRSYTEVTRDILQITGPLVTPDADFNGQITEIEARLRGLGTIEKKLKERYVDNEGANAYYTQIMMDLAESKKQLLDLAEQKLRTKIVGEKFDSYGKDNVKQIPDDIQQKIDMYIKQIATIRVYDSVKEPESVFDLLHEQVMTSKQGIAKQQQQFVFLAERTTSSEEIKKRYIDMVELLSETFVPEGSENQYNIQKYKEWYVDILHWLAGKDKVVCSNASVIASKESMEQAADATKVLLEGRIDEINALLRKEGKKDTSAEEVVVLQPADLITVGRLYDEFTQQKDRLINERRGEIRKEQKKVLESKLSDNDIKESLAYIVVLFDESKDEVRAYSRIDLQNRIAEISVNPPRGVEKGDIQDNVDAYLQRLIRYEVVDTQNPVIESQVIIEQFLATQDIGSLPHNAVMKKMQALYEDELLQQSNLSLDKHLSNEAVVVAPKRFDLHKRLVLKRDQAGVEREGLLSSLREVIDTRNKLRYVFLQKIESHSRFSYLNRHAKLIDPANDHDARYSDLEDANKTIWERIKKLITEDASLSDFKKILLDEYDSSISPQLRELTSKTKTKREQLTNLDETHEKRSVDEYITHLGGNIEQPGAKYMSQVLHVTDEMSSVHQKLSDQGLRAYILSNASNRKTVPLEQLLVSLFVYLPPEKYTDEIYIATWKAVMIGELSNILGRNFSDKVKEGVLDSDLITVISKSLDDLLLMKKEYPKYTSAADLELILKYSSIPYRVLQSNEELGKIKEKMPKDSVYMTGMQEAITRFYAETGAYGTATLLVTEKSNAVDTFISQKNTVLSKIENPTKESLIQALDDLIAMYPANAKIQQKAPELKEFNVFTVISKRAQSIRDLGLDALLNSTEQELREELEKAENARTEAESTFKKQLLQQYETDIMDQLFLMTDLIRSSIADELPDISASAFKELYLSQESTKRAGFITRLVQYVDLLDTALEAYRKTEQPAKFRDDIYPRLVSLHTTKLFDEVNKDELLG